MRFASLMFAALLALGSSAYAQDPEFEGQCAFGMSEGQVIATNCSVLWLAPDAKVYCFYNEEARQKFLKAPQENLQRAQASWRDQVNIRRLLRRE
ncbi:MAG: hypothetical protein ABI619_08405 [Betaproteobacteria bacterium]